MEFAEQLAQIEASPAGPHVGAFFDLDGTLVSGYTASTFFTDRVKNRDVDLGHFVSTFVSVIDGTYLGGEPTRGAIKGYAAMAGQSEETMTELGERLFVQKIAGTIRPQARELVRAHQRRGHTVAVASAASKYQIQAVAADLGIQHLVCTQLEVVDGILTGEITGRLLWGTEKASGVRAFAREHDIDLPASFAYGNGAEDVAFLGAVGSPVALNPHPVLRGAAANFRWPVLDLRDPSTGSVTDLARTVMALGGLNAGAATGVTWGLLTRNRQRGINLGVQLACQSALRLAGVDLRIVGAEHLPDGPAVYVANHQSSVDPLVAATIMPGEFTIVAKQEARFDPRSLVGSLLIEPAYIDRSNSAQSRATLDALVKRIRGGTSLLIFPEGTRSTTRALGRFRKGGFHLAIQAGVPIVPIVLRNTHEILPRHARVLRPGTIDVAILEPIRGLRVEHLDEQVTALRDRFAATLADWPVGPSAEVAR